MKPLTVVAILLLLSGSAQAVDPPGAATSMPADGVMPEMPPMIVTGSIAVKAVQGTKGGPKIALDEVTVELYGQGGKMQTIEAKLDEHGVVMIENLPLVAPFRPRVIVKHGGTPYTKDGEVMDAENPAQDIEITVFETSDKDPQLEVAMWHLILHPVEKGGLKVNETLAVRNMNDSAYLGTPDAEGRRIAIAIPLPKGVKKVDKVSGGLDECCTSVVNGRLLSKSPIKPGISQLRFQYTVPASGGSVAVDLVAPMVARQLMIFIPKDTEGFSSDHLKAGEVFDVHGKPMQAYTISDISAGQKISFTIAGPIPKASSLPKILAALGGVILVILCIVVLLIRRPEGELESNAA